MSRIPRWKVEKAKVKVVFRLQFHATHVPQRGWDKLFVSFIPLDIGKVAAKTNKANVKNGNCKWADPIYETTRLLVDTRTKKYDEKLYKLTVSMGTSRSSLLGEVHINLADFADAQKPSSSAFPLEGCEYGTVLHVTVQLLTSKTGFKEFEQQREVGEKGHTSTHETVEKFQTSPRVATLQMEKLGSNRAKSKPGMMILSSLQEVVESKEDSEDAIAGVDCSSYTSESVNTEKSDITGTPDANSITSKVTDQTAMHENLVQAENHILAEGSNDVAYCLNLDCTMKNHLTTVSLPCNSQYETLKASSLSEMWMEVSSLQKIADDLNLETQTSLQQLSTEIACGESLVREVSLLKSECMKIKSDMEAIKHAKEMLNFNSAIANPNVLPVHEQNKVSVLNELNEVMNSSVYLYPQISQITGKYGQTVASVAESFQFQDHVDNKDGQIHSMQVNWLQHLSLVEDKVKEIHSKVKHRYNGDDVDVLSDFLDLEAILLNLKEGTDSSFDNAGFEVASVSIDTQGTVLQKMQAFTSEDHCVGDSNNAVGERECQLLTELETLKIEQETLVKKMRQMECYYEALIHELEVSHSSTSHDLDTLKSEHSRCYYTISTLQTQIEKMNEDMNEQFSRFTEDRRSLDIFNKELENRALASENKLKKIRRNYSIAVERLQKDLKLLSDQVLSLFETNENLARQALVEASQLLLDDSSEVDSGNVSLNEKPKWKLISSMPMSNTFTLEEPMKAEELSIKDLNASELKMDESSLHTMAKKFNPARDDAEKEYNVTYRSSTLNPMTFHVMSNNHQVQAPLCDLSVGEMGMPFNVLQDRYLKTEAGLISMLMENVTLEVFANSLQEILHEKLDTIGNLEKEFDKLSQKLDSSMKSNELLELKVLNLADDAKKLRESEVRHIVEFNDLTFKNHILEVKLQEISDENSFLTQRLAECQILTQDISDLDAKYKACNAERLRVEELLNEEVANKSILEKEINNILEANEAMGIETSRYHSLVNDLENVVSFASDKLGNLCLNFTVQGILVNELADSCPTPEQDLLNKILHLEKLLEGTHRMLAKLTQDNKAIEEERTRIVDSLKMKDSSLLELTTQYNSSNALIKSLQLKLKDVADDFNACLETERFLSENNKELSSKLSGMELELQVAITEKNYLVERLSELDIIKEELGRTKLCFESCLHEKESLLLSFMSGNERNAELENEICSLKEKILWTNNEIFRGHELIEKINRNVSDLTVSVVEKQIHIDEHVSQITNLKLQIIDLEFNNSELRNLFAKVEEWKTKLEDEKALARVQVSDLEAELATCKECLRSLDFGLQAEKGCKEKLECKLMDLTSQLDKQCQLLHNCQKEKFELTRLHEQLLDLESEKSTLKSRLFQTEEDRKNLDQVVLLLRSQVSDLENELMNSNKSFMEVHAELSAERAVREKLNAMNNDLRKELYEKDEQIQSGKDKRQELDDTLRDLTSSLNEKDARIDEQIQSGKDKRQELDDTLRDLTSSLNEKDARIDEQKLEIINIKQELLDLESKKNKLQLLFDKSEESQKKVQVENFTLRDQICDLEAIHHELEVSSVSINYDLQSERDCNEKLQHKVSELTLIIQEKSQQLMNFESQNLEMLRLNQNLVDLESEKNQLQDILSKNLENAENLTTEVTVLRSRVIELENALSKVHEHLSVAHNEQYIENLLKKKLEEVVKDLQSELVEKEVQILSLKKLQQELEDICIKMKHLEAENSEHRNLLLKENERKSKLICENSSLLNKMANMDAEWEEMLKHVLSTDLKASFVESQYSEAFKVVTDQLHVLKSCYKELQLEYLHVKSILLTSKPSCAGENENLTSLLQNFKSKFESFTNDRSVILSEHYSSIDENDGLAKHILFEENQHLRGLLKNFEEETDSLKSARDELGIIIAVLKSKLDEQKYHLSIMNEYDAVLMKMREQQNELTYRLSEQILKTEEFKNLSIHLKELKDKADAEYIHTKEKKEIEGPSTPVQESLRMALIKEQCETKVQDMANQLSASKKHAEELLIMLQNTVDEVEFRKKSEFSHVKRNADLLLKLAELEGELERVTSEKEELQVSCVGMKAELECCSNNLNCCRDEKLKLEVSLRECNEDRTKSRVEVDLVRRRLEILSSSFEIFERDPVIGSPNMTSFEQLLDGKKLGLSLVLQQPLATRNIGMGKDDPRTANSWDTEEKETNLTETYHSLNDFDVFLQCKNQLMQEDATKESEGLPISPLGCSNHANLLGYNVDVEELITERENLQNSLEILYKELELLKSENLALHIPFDQYDADPQLCGLKDDLLQLDMANEYLENAFPLFKELSATGNALEKVLALELEFAKAFREKKKDIHFQSLFLEQHDNEEAILKSFKDINELIREMLLVKGRYAAVENELKEMQARYSQLSLQFAEVEGERQKLTMTLKNRTPKKH